MPQGDHEDLGVDMAGGLPRVRSMRKWYWPSPGPNGEPISPPVDGFDRKDTVQLGPESPPLHPDFMDESDNVPQHIIPTLYAAGGVWFSPWYKTYVRPHPVLCGPRGIIKVLPNHPHEGECYVPDDILVQLLHLMAIQLLNTHFCLAQVKESNQK